MDATWFSAISTFLAFLIALIVFICDQREKRRQSIRAQAEQISAWIEKEIKQNGMKALITLLNNSHNPIYHLIVTVVTFQGSGSKDGRQSPQRYQSYLGILPPGKSYILTDGDYRGVFFHPALELAFTDQSGRHWIRHGEGDLEPVCTTPEEYYNLDLPIGWSLPSEKPIK